MIDNNNKIKLGFVSSDTLASEKETKPLKDSNNTISNNNDDIVAKKDSNVNNVLLDGLNEICEDLKNSYQFGNIKIFLDIELNKICIINYNANDKYEVFKYIDKQTLKPTLISMIETRKRIKEIQDFELDKNSITKILNSVQGVKKAFNKNKEEFYTDSDYLPTLNMFIKTPLLNYEVKEKYSFVQLKEILLTKFTRLNLVFDSVLGKDLEGQKWFMDWMAMDMNEPDEIKTTIVLIGEQGSGKSIILEELSNNVYDNANISILDNKSIKDNFNDIYNFKARVIMNEISTMDLKESNQISQDLKRLITDGSYINRGMFKSGVEKTKTFNIVFSTNKNVPMQIENGDRRFSIFGRSLKLTDNKEIKDFLATNNDEEFTTFITKVKQEIKEFVYFLKCLDYDRNVSIKPLENDIKRKIVEHSNKKEDLFITYFNTRDFNKLEKFLKSYDWNNEEEFFTKFKYMWDCGIFENKTLFEIYVNIYDINIDKFNKDSIEKQSGFFWSKLLVKPEKHQIKITTNDKISVKVFNDEKFDIKREQIKCIMLGKYEEVKKYESNQVLINFDNNDNETICDFDENFYNTKKDIEIVFEDGVLEEIEELENPLIPFKKNIVRPVEKKVIDNHLKDLED